MPSFTNLINEKNKRLDSVPLALQTTVQKQQKKVLSNVLKQINKLEINKAGELIINAANLKEISKISDELKSIFLNEEYLTAVKEFGNEFNIQSSLNSKLIKKGFGETANPVAAKEYINLAKKKSIESLVNENMFVKPISDILETSVVNGASVSEVINSITTFVEGNGEVEGKILKYVKQITNDSFAIADRSYTSIVSDELGNDWFYFAGGEVENTRCFCEKRVGHYFHYKEIESWGRGENLEDCNIGNGMWAGEIQGTNEATIYSYLGGYNCMHSLMPVSEDIVDEADYNSAKSKGYL